MLAPIVIPTGRGPNPGSMRPSSQSSPGCAIRLVLAAAFASGYLFVTPAAAHDDVMSTAGAKVGEPQRRYCGNWQLSNGCRHFIAPGATLFRAGHYTHVGIQFCGSGSIVSGSDAARQELCVLLLGPGLRARAKHQSRYESTRSGRGLPSGSARELACRRRTRA